MRVIAGSASVNTPVAARITRSLVAAARSRRVRFAGLTVLATHLTLAVVAH